MFNSLGLNHVQINSITVAPKTQRQQKFGMAEIEEVDQDEDDNNLMVDVNEEANINSIMVNKIPIGKACSPYEVIQVQTEAGIFPVVIIYDTGSEVSLCNYETGPLIVNTKRGDKKVTISTINSIQAKLRKVHKLKVKDDWSLEAIMIPKINFTFRLKKYQTYGMNKKELGKSNILMEYLLRFYWVPIKQDFSLMKLEIRKELSYKWSKLDLYRAQ